jgi:hypothetical protein
MPHACLAIDRNNIIVAANTLAWELLNCRKDELVGFHIFSSPLPAALSDFYKTSVKQPGQLAETPVTLSPKTRAMKVRVMFSPPSEEWELALVTLQ